MTCHPLHEITKNGENMSKGAGFKMIFENLTYYIYDIKSNIKWKYQC